MDSLEMSSVGIRAREEALRQALDNPVRRHESQGIACGLPLESELLLELKAFALDCASPDHYAHALPLEVVMRAGRLKNLMAAVRGERPTGIGYQEPPPARCQKCDEE